MRAAKYVIRGSDCIGAFAAATEKYAFAGPGITKGDRATLANTLKAEVVELSISNSNLVGIFARANSRGMLISNLVTERELSYLKGLDLNIEVCVLDDPLNAVGNNIIANDRIAVVNPDYGKLSVKAIGDALGVEVVRGSTGGFKTVGANNIMTNRGVVVNNYCTDKEKAKVDRETGFSSVRATANTGSLGVGIAVVANSHGVVAGSNTTGFELARILEGLNIEDD